MCGAVRFTATNVASDFGTCYCDACRRWTSTGYSGVSADLSNLDIEGEDSIAVVDSSPWADRAFCKKCGSVLWYRQKGEDGTSTEISLSVGTLDGIGGMRRTLELFVDKKPEFLGPAVAERTLTEAQVMEMYAPKDAEV